MMGERLVMQDCLFYEFRLEKHVPADHQLRLSVLARGRGFEKAL